MLLPVTLVENTGFEAVTDRKQKEILGITTIFKFRNKGDKKMSEIEETKKNIEYWESEVQQAIKEKDINRAVFCRILANKLREQIEEETI